ncbi:MAG TPA: EAL domain-containing protein [Thermoanaerobaculia bacterium]|nr:EAL domain-containing protein [Thermoanaerobaculia bacterium]
MLRDDESRLRRQNAVLVDLARRPLLQAGNLGEALREIAVASSATLEVDRVGIWLYTPDRQALRCSELFERIPRQHSSGTELRSSNFPVYFRALESERSITAHDAQLDPRTSAFTDPYLIPFAITSMLDAPIRRLGQVTGVVCFEHTGPQRTWTIDEESFASSIADLVAMAVDATDRRQAQEALRHRVEFEQLVAGISTRFLSVRPDELDAEIERALAAAGPFIGAERMHVWLISPDGLSAHMTHDWSAPGVELTKDRYGEFPTAAFPWWMEHLHRFERIVVNSLDDLPPEALNERRVFERQGIRSAAIVPMVLDRRLYGTVGCSTVSRDVRWSDMTFSLLRFMAEIVVSAIERNRTMVALHASEQRHRLLFERNLAGVYRNTTTGAMLDCNDAMARMLGFDSREEFLGLDAHDLYFDRAERDRFVEAVRREGGVRNMEVCLRAKDGRPVWLLESVHLLEGEPEILEGTVIDITDRKLADNALRESEARYRLLAENSTDMISRTTARGRFVYVSDTARQLLGYEPSEMIGRSIFELSAEEDHHILRDVTELLDEPQTFTYRVHRKDGSLVWFESRSRALRDASGAIAEVIAVTRDISERRRAEEQIEYQAYHDALTGLPNRLLFRDRLTMALAHAKRQQTPLAVMFLDLDRFKYVNDTLGHSHGDELLRVVAARLRGVLREGDTIARMGGDEFTILSELCKADDAATIAQTLLDTVAEPLRIDGQELYVTTSIGIALYPNDGETAESLLQSADSAMYRAKEAGRSSYQLCTPAMNQRAAERLSIESALRRALDRDELVLHYQPQVRVGTREIVGMEALLRWNRPGHGLVPPATFIGVAEETRMIVPIGEWVLRKACVQAKAWQRGAHPLRRIAVNLSPRQFLHADLGRVVAAALEESGLEPRFLELEITESTAMTNTERSIATLAGLREMGVRIALDDFGTGHSSLSYLRRFPIDRVKIDQEFVQAIETSRSNRAIVSGIISMAHGLDLAVTAEGVETEPQLSFLEEEQCEEVQGFLFGAATPA